MTRLSAELRQRIRIARSEHVKTLKPWVPEYVLEITPAGACMYCKRRMKRTSAQAKTRKVFCSDRCRKNASIHREVMSRPLKETPVCL